MTRHPRQRIGVLARAAAPVAGVAFAMAILLRFPPTQYTFYPQCPFYYWLHLKCPGCGTTRALAALLHGHVADALRQNALTTMMAGFAVAYAVICYRRYLRGEEFLWPQLPRLGVYAALAIAILFTIVRNLPLHLL